MKPEIVLKQISHSANTYEKNKERKGDLKGIKLLFACAALEDHLSHLLDCEFECMHLPYLENGEQAICLSDRENLHDRLYCTWDAEKGLVLRTEIVQDIGLKTYLSVNSIQDDVVLVNPSQNGKSE